MSAADVDRIAFHGYGCIWSSLGHRSSQKARFLTAAYVTFFVALAVGAAAVAVVVTLDRPT